MWCNVMETLECSLFCSHSRSSDIVFTEQMNIIDENTKWDRLFMALLLKLCRIFISKLKYLLNDHSPLRRPHLKNLTVVHFSVTKLRPHIVFCVYINLKVRCSCPLKKIFFVIVF